MNGSVDSSTVELAIESVRQEVDFSILFDQLLHNQMLEKNKIYDRNTVQNYVALFYSFSSFSNKNDIPCVINLDILIRVVTQVPIYDFIQNKPLSLYIFFEKAEEQYYNIQCYLLMPRVEKEMLKMDDSAVV